MAKIRTLGPGQLIIGEQADAHKFDADCTKATLTPKTDVDDTQTFLDGHDEAGEQNTTWTLETTIKEDFSADGLQAWCFDNAGKTKHFKFIPNNAGELAFEGDVLIAPVAVGGDVKKKNDQDVSFTATNVKRLQHSPETPQPDGQTVTD
ncbi:hypothetical protein OZX72_03015 [Bifidobacterium sp. ESL0769]|uniref:hypothetical protein n=1 Tax=Bifidobacterium sp. ESL0769 TaxID=2983229 RepID=UPI0023F649D1|nr:hypothetical protein [Bifidobacterium sp. ESL0769]WEV67968.1 hypothetical protein OZX72_03015 [Bifidobacterium sp. ESL0769]